MRRRAEADAAAWAAEREALIARAEEAEHALSESQMRVLEIELGVVQPPTNAPSTARGGAASGTCTDPHVLSAQRSIPAVPVPTPSCLMPRFSQSAWEHGAAEEARERYRELEDDLDAAEAKVQARGGRATPTAHGADCCPL